MKERKVAVIGSNCFTGSHVVDALLEDDRNRVLGISRSPEYKRVFLPYADKRAGGRFEFQQLDLVGEADAVLRSLDRFEPEVVVYVAALSEVALSNERPVEYFDVNTSAVVRLCNHLRTRPYLGRYVHFSSAEIFGNCEGPVDESSSFRPSTPYAVSKAAADMALEVLIKNFGFPATIIRSTNVYGRHQQLYKIIPRTILYVKQGKTIDLHNGGRAVKSFVHVRDVVRGAMLAIDRGGLGAYHFSVDSERTVADVVRAVCDRLGCDFEQVTRTVGERLGQDGRYWLDCSRARRELGWQPRIDFEEGVAEVVAWIEENWDQVAMEPHFYVHKAA